MVGIRERSAQGIMGRIVGTGIVGGDVVGGDVYAFMLYTASV
jgi:hypothetical protein